MSRPTANLRLFVAIHPPIATATALLVALKQLGSLPPRRATPVEQVHLTLQFIGDTPARELDATRESVERAAAGLRSFMLAPQRLITLPDRGPARLIAVETDAPPTLLELHRRLAARLAHHVRDKRDERFRPHITLCRFRLPVQNIRINQPLADDCAFEVSRITLMRSTLSPSGAMHHEVQAITL